MKDLYYFHFGLWILCGVGKVYIEIWFRINMNYNKKMLVAMWYLFSGHSNAEEISDCLEIDRAQLLLHSLEKARQIENELLEEIKKLGIQNE